MGSCPPRTCQWETVFAEVVKLRSQDAILLGPPGGLQTKGTAGGREQLDWRPGLSTYPQLRLHPLVLLLFEAKPPKDADAIFNCRFKTKAGIK